MFGLSVICVQRVPPGCGDCVCFETGNDFMKQCIVDSKFQKALFLPSRTDLIGPSFTYRVSGRLSGGFRENCVNV